MERQRRGLSQEDLAFLIAMEQRGSVSRFEKGLRFPNLEAALALEIVLGQPIRSLFAGMAERVEESIRSRAATLLESLDDTSSKEMVLKLELLSKLAHPDEHHVIPIWQENA
jgi:transcriptional regulator with XRE-family HTH domain